MFQNKERSQVHHYAEEEAEKHGHKTKPFFFHQQYLL